VATLKGINLTLLMGPAVPVPAPRELVEALESAQVTVAAGQRSGFQLVFGASKDSIITKTLIPAGFFDPLIRVVLVCTINSTPEVLIDGVITRQEMAPSNQPNASKLTITGEDLSAVMDLVDLTGVPYPAIPPVAVIALILARYAVFGVIPAPVPPIFNDIENPLVRVPAQKGTDFAFITALAEQVGYVFYIEPGPAPGSSIAYWGPEVRVGLPQPALGVNMDAASNVDTLTFSLDGNARTQYIAIVQEPITKVSIPVPIPDVGILKPPLSARPPLPLKVKKLDTTAKFSMLKAIAYGVGQTAKSNDAVSGNGSLDVLRYGGTLKARRLVGVRGAGRGYDGLYYVKSVTSTLKRGEFKQSFSLVRDGLISLTPTVPT
jgi:hypothetical protein